jgi:hypothetical protein
MHVDWDEVDRWSALCPSKIYIPLPPWLLEETMKKFKLSLRTKDNHTPDEIKRILKAKVNRTEINAGITSLKSLIDGRVIIEVGSKQEIESLGGK